MEYLRESTFGSIDVIAVSGTTQLSLKFGASEAILLLEDEVDGKYGMSYSE